MSQSFNPAHPTISSYAGLQQLFPAYRSPSTGPVTCSLEKLQCPTPLAAYPVTPHCNGNSAMSSPSVAPLGWHAAAIAAEQFPAIGILGRNLLNPISSAVRTRSTPRTMTAKMAMGEYPQVM